VAITRTMAQETINRTNIKILVISRISNNMAITKQWVPKEHQDNQVKEGIRECKWVTCLSSNKFSKCSSSKTNNLSSTSDFLTLTSLVSTQSKAKTERTSWVTPSIQLSKPSTVTRLPESSRVCFSTSQPSIKESSSPTTPSSLPRSKKLIIFTWSMSTLSSNNLKPNSELVAKSQRPY